MNEQDRFEENSPKERDEIFSKAVRAGKRTYFFDVKSTRNDEFYLTITESKKKNTPDGKYFYEKHKIFLYKEDFEKFVDGLGGAIGFINENNVAMPRDFNTHQTDPQAPVDPGNGLNSYDGNAPGNNE